MVVGPSTGFQAVILCGPGTSLYPFTGAGDLPKALLPIANKPMIQYSLEWCEEAGFSSTLILTISEHLIAIQSYIHSHTYPFAIQVEAPSALDDNLGTADVLRRAYKHGWMTGDIVVLPCDLVTDLDPEEILKIWMIENTGFDNDICNRSKTNANVRENYGKRGGLGVWYETKGDGAVRGQETDFLALAPHPEPSIGSDIGYHQDAGTLKTLLYNHPGIVFKEQRVIPLRKSFLRKCRNFQINSSRRDSGIYFFPFWLLKFINQNPQMNSIREDVLPWWSKARWQNKNLAKRLGLLDILSDSENLDQRFNVGEMSTTRKRDTSQWTLGEDKEILPVYTEFGLEVMAKQKRGIVVFKAQEPIHEAPKSDTSSIATPPDDIKIPPMTVYLPIPSTTFIRRVDTIQLYLSTSLYLANPAFPTSQVKIHPSASIDQKAHVNRSDCLIASKVIISQKAVVKRCVLGHGVSIARSAKLLGCVLMDGASVAEGASLEGCVVGRNAVIGAEAKLKDCQVSQGFFVEPEMQAKNEIFIAFARLGDGNDASIASQFESDGTYKYNEDEGQDKQQNGLYRPRSPVKPVNTKQAESNKQNKIQTDIIMTQGHQTQTGVKEFMETETKKNSIDNNGGQKTDRARRNIIETVKTDNPGETDSFKDQNYKGQKDQKDQINKDEIPGMNCKLDMLYNPARGEELLAPAKPSPAYLDELQDNSGVNPPYKNTTTKQEVTETAPAANSTSTIVTEAIPNVGSITTRSKGSGLSRTWGLSILTLGFLFAVFTTICTVVERNGNMF